MQNQNDVEYVWRITCILNHTDTNIVVSYNKMFCDCEGHLEMVKFLLEAGADQEHKTDEMHTALMEASMDGHVEVARLLLDSGAQVSLSTYVFETSSFVTLIQNSRGLYISLQL